jgi:hypothetical protein
VLLKYAKQFAAEAAKAAEGSEERKQYAAYAAYCYEEALVYDPSNPDIYDDIGTQYVAVGNDDSAIAYLARAVELRPWDPPTANPYRQLGRAYRDQKQDANALAAWAEGLAKYPYSPGIWDDRAHYHADREAYADAAYDASVALACGPRPARVAPLQKLLRTARGHLDDAATTDLNKRVAHDALANDLDQMRQRSNRSRKRRSLYVTVPFVALMKTIGTLDVPGVEDRIGQTPLRAPPKLAIGDDASTADDGDDSPKHPTDPAAKDGGKKHPAHPDQDDGTDTVTPPATGGGDDRPDHPPGKKPKPRITHPDQDPDDTPGAGMASGGDGAAPKRQAAGTTGGDDWLGTKAKSTPAAGGATTQPAEVTAPNVILPRPAVTGLDLGGDVQTVDDAKVVPVDLDTALVSDVVVSTDGASAFIVQKDGLLRKLSVPSLKEERQTDLGSPVTGMGLTRDGLAVAVSGVNEIWLLDPATLEVKHRVALAGVTRLATSVERTGLLAAVRSGTLAVVEPSSESVTARYTAADLAASAGGKVADVRFDLLVMAPDGHHVYLDGSDCICKFGLSGSTLSFQAAGPKLGTPTALMVSPDGRYVAMPCREGDAPVAGQAKQPFATYVFRATNLDAAVMTVQTGPTPGPLAFDPVAKQLYGQSDTRQLIVFAPTGEKVKDYVVVPNATTQKLVVSPDGRRLFVLAGGKLVWVTLP